MGYSILSGWPFVFANKFHIFVEEIPKPMKKRLYIFALLVAAVFVACQPTLVTPDDEEQTQQSSSSRSV